MMDYREIAFEKIRPGKNIRGEDQEIETLASSIRDDGLLHPLIASADSEDQYAIVAGHRRFQAISKIHEDLPEMFSSVPCILVDGSCRVERQVTENMVRKNLTQLELGDALLELKEKGHSNAEIARYTGKGVGYVKNLLVGARCVASNDAIRDIMERHAGVTLLDVALVKPLEILDQIKLLVIKGEGELTRGQLRRRVAELFDKKEEKPPRVPPIPDLKLPVPVWWFVHPRNESSGAGIKLDFSKDENPDNIDRTVSEIRRILSDQRSFSIKEIR